MTNQEHEREPTVTDEELAEWGDDARNELAPRGVGSFVVILRLIAALRAERERVRGLNDYDGSELRHMHDREAALVERIRQLEAESETERGFTDTYIKHLLVAEARNKELEAELAAEKEERRKAERERAVFVDIEREPLVIAEEDTDD